MRLALYLELSNEAERFHTINYASIDAPYAMAQRVSDLTVQYGVLNREAVAAYEAIAAAQFGRNQIDSLAKTMVQANRITGISAQALTTYASRLRESGYTADDTAKQLGGLINMQAKMKISTADMTRVLQSGYKLTTMELEAFLARAHRRSWTR